MEKENVKNESLTIEKELKVKKNPKLRGIKENFEEGYVEAKK